MMKNKRLAVFALYDQDGIADDYVLFWLKELKEIVDELVVVCNGGLREDQMPRVKKYADSIFLREDRGFDGTAYKEALEQHITWKRLHEFDELLLINDSCYGPFRPLETIFGDMSGRECDFWCLTDMQAKLISGLPYHLQPYFAVVRHRLLHDNVFQEFWHSMPEIKIFRDAIEFFEFRFTMFFMERGFIGAAWCDTDKLHTANRENELQDDYIPVVQDCFRLISEFNLPVVKRKAFRPARQGDVFRSSMGESPARMLDYIEHNTTYDIGLIWKNLIRISNPKELKDSLNLSCILPMKIFTQMQIKNHKIVVIAYLKDEDKYDIYFSYLQQVPSGIKLYVVVDSQKARKAVEIIKNKMRISNASVVLLREGGNTLTNTIELFYDYEYACFISDCEFGGSVSERTIDNSIDVIWENLFKSAAYINNLIEYFETHPYIGLLTPPYHWLSLSKANLWEGDFQCIKAIANKLELPCVLSKEYEPVLFGCSCWCRPKALSGVEKLDTIMPILMDKKVSYQTIGKLLPYVAQSNGYATSTVMNEEYATVHISNQLEYLSEIIREKAGEMEHLALYELLYLQLLDVVQQLFKKCKDVYIYGAGDTAAYLVKSLGRDRMKLAGCIVSDGRKRMNQFYGLDIIELSSFDAPRETSGIILAIAKASEIMPKLLKMGYTNICVAERQGW